MNRTAKNRAPGFVLVCVLWALAVLTILTFGFARRALLDRRAAAVSCDYMQARFLARGAVERGLADVRNEQAMRWLVMEVAPTASNAPTTKLAMFRWQTSANLIDQGEVFASSGGPDFADDSCVYRIEDAESRISLNTAPAEILEEIPGIGFRTVNAILRRRGNEEADEPAEPFVAIEEVMYLTGVDEALWYGTNNHPGLRDLVTVWGDGRINVNTASADVLRCIPDIGESVVDAIVSYRAGGDGELHTDDDRTFSSFSAMPGILDLGPDELAPVVEFCSLEPRFYRITGRATRRRGKVSGECTAVIAVLEDQQIVMDWREGSSAS